MCQQYSLDWLLFGAKLPDANDFEPPASSSCSYVSAGLQAVLEFYFVHYLYVCSGTKRATSLGTTSVNVYITIYQLCAISAGILADKIIGTCKWIDTICAV
jgi:hypothetical protein